MEKAKMLKILEQINNYMEELEKEYGIKIATNTKYDSYHANMSIKIKDINLIEEDEEKIFRREALRNCCNPDWYGKEFNWKGEDYKVIKIDTRARKYKVICELKSNNHKYGFEIDHVKSLLKDNDFNPFKGMNITVHNSDGTIEDVTL